MSGLQSGACFSDTSFQNLVPVAGLPTVRRNLLFGRCELQPLRKGDTLFQEGDKDERLYYLIEGRIELSGSNNTGKIVEAGNGVPLDPLCPHSMTARALSPVTVLHCPRGWFDAMLLPPLLQLNQAVDASEQDEVDWLQNLLASGLFTRLPAPNLQQLFSQCEPLAFGKDQAVITQGEKSDGFYIIQAGHCELRYVDANQQPLEEVAVLGPGDWFGEISLLTGCPNSVTVTMLSDGALLRLDPQAFDELIRLPLVTEVDISAAGESLQHGARWLNVREAAETDADPQADAVHHPFTSLLLQEIADLDNSLHYVTVCDSGARSAVAAFLLALQGYSVSWLRGGLAALRGHAVAAGAAEDKTSGSRHDPLLQALRSDLTRLLRQVDNAMQLKSSAEHARREAERAAHTQIHAERKRLDQQAEQVRNMLEQTQQLQRRLAQEKERLYAGLKRREAAVERRITNLNTYIERRVAEERERIESRYQARESEIVDLESKRQAAASRLQSDEKAGAADEDKQAASAALEAEFDQFNQALRDAESERERLQSVGMAQELVSEISENLADDEKEKLARYQSTQSYLTHQREQLESRARQLSSVVQEALFDKQASAAVRDALLREAEESADNEKDTAHDETDDALRAATARYNEAEEAHKQALEAQQENASALAQTEEAESKLLQDMNAEIEAWLQEQASQQHSPKQQALIQRYEETMQRMHEEAVQHEEQERTRDDLLQSEINDALATIAEQRGKQT